MESYAWLIFIGITLIVDSLRIFIDNYVSDVYFKGKNAVINEPARGRVTVSWEEFDREYTGVCATFEPDEGFEPSGKPKSPFSYARERLKGTTRPKMRRCSRMKNYRLNLFERT